jgi:bifunctional DNA-binding transcriptional regulator/antitoxin component of YhaV-PrlF toxin-antitoxin module
MPIVEQRMIYRVGKSSLAITLPQNWLRYFGLKPGDKVEITANGELTIRPLKKARDFGQKIRWPEGELNI